MNVIAIETPESRDRESTLFALACELPLERRSAFLDAGCGGDDALRRRLESLLRAHDNTDILSVPPAPVVATPGKVAPSPGAESAVGQHLGRYKILEVLGEGGCGVVYVAEQSEPVRRRVAVKVIKLGMDTRAVIARFEAERQALAMMDHPNIARVFDAGSTESGRPFFVMELVRGIRITDYCDQACLSARDRIELFIKVCHAIQHAHQKGIIHRDIKPSNILVTLHDGVAVPKVIDFGIAKAIEGRLGEATVYTQLHQFVGTPAYMSPEQAEMNGLDIDTRSDVYSLGVLLYELLTGTTPLDGRELVASGLDGMRRAIRDQEPARPSTRLSSLGLEARTTAARRRSMDLPRLVSQLKGDLDWVVMKCLEKDRTRRYETASSLAADLGRHLLDEPVQARPPSVVYRLRKAVHRNRLAFAAGGMVFAALIFGLVLTSWQAVRARREADRANREALRAGTAEAVAARRLAESEAVSQYLANLLQSPNPGQDGHTVTIADTLRAAARRLDLDLAEQPDRRVAFQQILADTYRGLGLHEEEAQLREKVLTHWVAKLGSEHPDSLAAQRRLANSLASSGNWEKAIPIQEALLPICIRVNGPTNANTLLTMRDLAASYRELGRNEESILLLERALSAAGTPHPPEDVVTLELLNSLGVSYGTVGRLEESERLFRQSLALSRQLRGQDNPKTLSLLNNLAVTHVKRGKTREATALFEEALRLSGTRNGPAHPDTWRYLGAVVGRRVAEGRSDEAERVLDEALPQLRELTGPSHPELKPASAEVAASCLELATARAWAGDASGYSSLCRKLLDWAAATRDPITADRIAKGCLLRPSADPEVRTQALILAQRAVDLGRTDNFLPYFRLCLGMAQLRNSLCRQAEATLREAEQTGVGLFGVQPMARCFRAICLQQLGRVGEAQDLLKSVKESIDAPPETPEERARAFANAVSADQLMVWMAYEEARNSVSSREGAQP